MPASNHYSSAFIKRLFCLMLCLSMLLPGVSHAHAEDAVEWIDAVEHADEHTHEHVDDEVFIFETGALTGDAPVATDIFPDEPAEPEPLPEPLCGHESTQQVPGARGAETEWVFETEEYHVRSYEQAYQVVCAACGETLSEASQWQDEQARHRFAEDGACKDCKWRPAEEIIEEEEPVAEDEPVIEEPVIDEPVAEECEHCWQDCVEASEYTAWGAVDEAQHSRAHRTALGRVCIACGALEHVSELAGEFIRTKVAHRLRRAGACLR